MHLFFDITRLCQHKANVTPSGIDRVEFAYFSYLMRKYDHSKFSCVLTTPLGQGVVRAERAKYIHDMLQDRWCSPLQANPVFSALMDELNTPPDLARKEIAKHEFPDSRQMWSAIFPLPASDMLRAGARLKRRLAALQRETQSVYINSSHSQLSRPKLFNWLKEYGTQSVFFLHDLIPIDYPEYCRPGEAAKHRRRMSTIANHAMLILANSDYTSDTARQFFASKNLRSPPIVTLPLAVDTVFTAGTANTRSRTAHPYAVVLGTIEPRKNLAFLLTIWRRLYEMMGERTPRLVIIGRRGWENESVIDILERSEVLAPYVVEVSGMSDAGVADIMGQAAMLLAPSLVEGFSLPVAEALSLGLPVIASDIAAHREIGQGFPCFVDPLDGPGWIAAIQRFLQQPAVKTDTPYVAWNWDEHVEQGIAIIRDQLKVN